mgnify:CR=1 FL=1
MRWNKSGLLVALSVCMMSMAAAFLAGPADAQRRPRNAPVRVAPIPPPPEPPPVAAPKDAAPAAIAPVEVPKEVIQADVSTRSVAVTSTFSGTEIVIYGIVENSRQPTAESGFYDVVVVTEGVSTPMVARRKAKVAGIWINTRSVQFDSVPSFYAVSSTRPIDEIASDEILRHYEIGLPHVRMVLSKAAGVGLAAEDLKGFRDAIVRIKRKEGLYVVKEYDTSFTHRSLFRTTIELPANVSVGSFDARVFLFRDGKLLSQYIARLSLEREGVERLIHGFAFQYPWIYGIATVLIALASGVLASTVFSKARH